jgi:hypothetical protein
LPKIPGISQSLNDKLDLLSLKPLKIKAFFNEVPKYASYSQISEGKILLLNRLA